MVDLNKVFREILRYYIKSKTVTYVSGYENIRKIIPMVCSLPNIEIENIQIESPEYDNYNKAFLLTICDNNTLWVTKAYFENGYIAKGNGIYLIDPNAIGENSPEDFLSDNRENKIILMGGEIDV